MWEMSSCDYYFDSYSHFGIHEEMLKDEVRTLSYRNVIYRNRHLFEGKTVLDVGCGTGILCMFAASAGAKLVIGVDMSNIIEQARVIVRDNQLEDRIVLLKGKMEEVELPVDKVDIIISEWMGYFLLYESMLETVLYARDRYLAEDGLMFPDQASMVMVGIEDAEYKDKKVHFWDDVYGFNMSSVKELVLREPLVDSVESKAVITNECVFKEIDIRTATKQDLSFAVPFQLTVSRTDYLHAFVAYFNVVFSAGHKPVRFGTGPYDRYTHWRQTVFYLRDDLAVNKGDVILGRISCSPNQKNPRDLDIVVGYEHKDSNGVSKGSGQLDYHMC